MKRVLFAVLRPFMLVGLVGGLVVGMSSGVVAAADIESQARAIEGKLMAPCCMANTVAEHHSGIALEMRQEIRDMLAQGQSSDEILAHYVAKHGDKILAMPASTGFNLVPWLAPLAFLLVGPGLIILVLRRWTAKHAADQAAEEPAAPIDPEYAARLEKRVAELD